MKEKIFVIKGLVRGRKYNFIYTESGTILASYDGFKLEDELNRLRGMYPSNIYKIVEAEIKDI